MGVCIVIIIHFLSSVSGSDAQVILLVRGRDSTQGILKATPYRERVVACDIDHCYIEQQ